MTTRALDDAKREVVLPPAAACDDDSDWRLRMSRLMWETHLSLACGLLDDLAKDLARLNDPAVTEQARGQVARAYREFDERTRALHGDQTAPEAEE